MTFPEHPLRQRLQQEFHARPPIPLNGAMLIAHLVFLHNSAEQESEERHLAALCESGDGTLVERSESLLVFDNGVFQLRWELHTEFSSYTFFQPPPAPTGAGEAASALDAVPADWLAGIPGQMMVGTHIEMRPTATAPTAEALAQLAPEARQVVVTKIADGAAWVISDLQFADGFTRFLLLDHGLTPRQAGRTVQRLWELETYRMMAMIGFPVAKEIGRWLRGSEAKLAQLMDRIGSARGPEDERAVLNELSLLAAEVEHSLARTGFRFGASRAYHGLVQHRIAELREQRVKSYPTLKDFIERRLLPPMNTCQAMTGRQEELSGRVARNSLLLRTRVDIELERQNQELLGQMNRRAKLQLHLQQTVEGLSVVAITYYGSQIVQYLAKAVSKFVPAISPELATGISIPFIALVVALGLHRMHKHVAVQEHEVTSSGVH